MSPISDSFINNYPRPLWHQNRKQGQLSMGAVCLLCSRPQPLSPLAATSHVIAPASFVDTDLLFIGTKNVVYCSICVASPIAPFTVHKILIHPISTLATAPIKVRNMSLFFDTAGTMRYIVCKLRFRSLSLAMCLVRCHYHRLHLKVRSQTEKAFQIFSFLIKVDRMTIRSIIGSL